MELRFVGQYARFEEFEQGFDNSEYTSIGPNNQFDNPSMVIGSRMNDDTEMSHYQPSIEADPF